jgi:UDP-N-acetylmuramoyl-L-alanyl-D-glutamate--2,6-diaminopimelate ligase
MKLRELLRDVKVRESRADLDVGIASVTADSRMATPGALFVAIPGLKTDGAKFIDAATRKGAAAIVGESSAATVQVDDTRAALSIIAANYYGRPADKLSLVGVTGTSGKTTTAKMIESIFDARSNTAPATSASWPTARRPTRSYCSSGSRRWSMPACEMR